MKIKSILSAVAYWLIYLLAGAAVAFFMVITISQKMLQKGAHFDAHVVGQWTTVITSFVYGLILLLFYAFFKLRKKDVKSEWRFNGFTKAQALYACGAGFFLEFARLFFQNNGATHIPELGTYSPLLLICTLITSLLISPFTNQCLINGIVYTRAEKGNGPAAGLVTSVILPLLLTVGVFVLPLITKMPISTPLSKQVINTILSTLSSVFFAYLFYKSASLWLCILTASVCAIPTTLMSLVNYPADNIRIPLCVVFAIIGILLLWQCIRVLRKPVSIE